MTEKKEYRNAIRSRMLIRAAFINLLHEKPYEKITATDIIKRANINRSTFYAHYPDVLGIMDEIMDEIVARFQFILSQHDFRTFLADPEPILQNIISFMEENQELYRLMGRSSMAYEQLEKLKGTLINKIVEDPELPKEFRSSLSGMMRVRLLMNGIIDTYRQWLAGDFVCSLDEITEELIRIISQWARISE